MKVSVGAQCTAWNKTLYSWETEQIFVPVVCKLPTVMSDDGESQPLTTGT